jgi:transcription initiation factor IIF auxiliary subunit
MKKLYVIFPVLGLLAFSGVYFQHRGEARAKAAARATETMAKADAAETARVASERQAREDAERRRQARETEEVTKLAEKKAKLAADLSKLAEEQAAHTARATAQQTERATLEITLAELRATKIKLQDELLSAEKMVAEAQIERRKADLENQRFISQIEARAAGR